jgi:hypothetical protein
MQTPQDFMIEAQRIGLATLESRKTERGPELATKKTERVDAEAREQDLKLRHTELIAESVTVANDCEMLFARYSDELVDMGNACNFAGYADLIARKREQNKFLDQTMQRLVQVRLPHQRLQVLIAIRDERFVEAVLAELDAMISAERLRVALEPVVQSEGRIHVAGEVTENLCAASVAAWARHAEAVVALAAEQNRQQRNAELLTGTGTVTRKNIPHAF